MKTRFLMLLAAMLLASVYVFAQSNKEPLKGDVNGDGKVDVADIAAVIKIMKDGGGTAGEKTYYWYVGQTDPSTMTSISPIVTDNSSPGWRLTGTTLNADYEFNTTDNPITDSPSKRAEWYIALPEGTSYHIWDDGYTEQFDSYYITDETVTFDSVRYKIYKPGTSARTLSGQLIKK